LGEIIGCTFTNNTSFNFGAVFLQGYNEDQWFVKNCQFTNNKATKAGGMAGALWHSGLNNGRFDVSNSTFENNEARTHGGAIACTRGANNFTNCTFYGNLTRDAGGLGGGIYNIGDDGSTWFSTITNCTFANNIAGGYGGAWVITGSKGSVKNTIIANNKAYQQCGYPAPAGCQGYNNGNNCAGLLTDNGNNIEFPERPKRVANPNYADPTDNPCFTRPVVLNSSAMPVVDPRLLAPANNGGPTRTMALQAGSPAINAGSGCPAADQRGAPRAGACDIGAFEFGTALAARRRGPAARRLGPLPQPQLRRGLPHPAPLRPCRPGARARLRPQRPARARAGARPAPARPLTRARQGLVPGQSHCRPATLRSETRYLLMRSA
jgi:predicted outer membrane repeat protein